MFPSLRTETQFKVPSLAEAQSHRQGNRNIVRQPAEKIKRPKLNARSLKTTLEEKGADCVDVRQLNQQQKEPRFGCLFSFGLGRDILLNHPTNISIRDVYVRSCKERKENPSFDGGD